MYTKTHLIKVEPNANNNKVYIMTPNGVIPPTTFKAQWGRYGNTNLQSKDYPISQWDKKRKEKLRKGYQDVTQYQTITTPTPSSNTVTSPSPPCYQPIADKTVAQLIESLMGVSKTVINTHYEVTADGVSQQQIDEAQAIVDTLSGWNLSLSTPSYNTNTFNDALIALFHVIPRKMKRVNEHLIDDVSDNQAYRKIIQREQQLLDTMKGQVNVVRSKGDVSTDEGKTLHEENKAHGQPQDSPKRTLLDSLGVRIEYIDKDVDSPDHRGTYLAICDGCGLMGSDVHRLLNVFKVETIHHEKQYRQFVQGIQANDDTAHHQQRQMLWHGSRTENWISILQSSLLVRPSNAVLTGAMFGNGIYFSSKMGKSLGYTSVKDAYWTSGSGGQHQHGYIGLYSVLVGQSYVVDRHQYWMESLNWKGLRNQGDYYSLHAPAGYDLRNPETIIYQPQQCTIRYLVQVC